MPDFVWMQEVVFPILGMGIAVLAMFGLYRTVNRALDRRHERAMGSSGGASREEIDRLVSRIDALEESTERVQELEERMDFTERVLTQQQERDRLAPGRGGRG